MVKDMKGLFPNLRVLYVVCLWCLLTGCGTLGESVSSGNSDSVAMILSRTAKQLVDGLEKKVVLSGKKIQVSENNFWERDTKINLAFSAVLRDALAAALSKRGVTVTVQEVGGEPLTVVGSYGVEGSDLVITVRVRRMEKAESKDIAVCREKMPVVKLDKGWLKPEFARVARTLVRMLEDSYYGDGLDVSVSSLLPVSGQPAIKLGQEFVNYLETAVADSAYLRSSGFSTGKVDAKMEGTYSRVNGLMHFHVKVVDLKGSPLTVAQFDVAVEDIPDDMMKPYGKVRVCAHYTSLSDELPVGSPAAAMLLNYIGSTLNAYGLVIEPCSPGQGNLVRVEVSMTVKRKHTNDGNTLVSGIIDFKMVDGDKRVIGTLSKRGTAFFDGNLERTIEQIIRKTFRSTIGEELAKIILVR